MSQRRSKSRSHNHCKSEEKMVYINLSGLDSLCNIDSGSSLNSQGSDEEDCDDMELGGDEGYSRRQGQRGLPNQHYPESYTRERYPQNSAISLHPSQHMHHAHSHGPVPHQHYPQPYYPPPPGQMMQPQPPPQQQQTGQCQTTAPAAPPCSPPGQIPGPPVSNTPPCQPAGQMPPNQAQPPPQAQVDNNQQNPCSPQSGNPRRDYSLNVTACSKGLEKLEAQFEIKPTHIEIRATLILKTTPDRYVEDIDTIAKTLVTETEKCIQNCPPEDNKGNNSNCYATTALMHGNAVSEIRRRMANSTTPAWVKH